MQWSGSPSSFPNTGSILLLTYEGIVSDVRALADIAHKYNMPLIVDEAHGAHFGLAEGFPDTAISQTLQRD